MEKFKVFTQAQLSKITNYRIGEVKFGEKMHLVPKNVTIENAISETEAPYILFGIPEDIGVLANLGRQGTATAWDNAITNIANIQHNKFCKGNKIMILGAFDFDEDIKLAKTLDYTNIEDRKKLYALVQKIDKEVSHLVFTIVKLGKTPIIIGGGHNNSYGNIKGTALAKGKAINAINFDAHSDFRILEGRHSGNGFSYAYEEGFLKKYFIFGLHESYTSKSVLDIIKKTDDRVRYNTYDEISIHKCKEFDDEINKALEYISCCTFGLEVDLDSIPNIASSAMTPSGFSVEQLRSFVSVIGQNKNVAYFHICEGAPELGDQKNPNLVGKLIGYLVTDFIKSHSKE